MLTEPDAGIGPIYRLIAGARSSVDLTMYELADPRAEADLAADAARGVDVRVILDQHLEKSRNRAAELSMFIPVRRGSSDMQADGCSQGSAVGDG